VRSWRYVTKPRRLTEGQCPCCQWGQPGEDPLCVVCETYDQAIDRILADHKDWDQTERSTASERAWRAWK
jgi:hypothetical protein